MRVIIVCYVFAAGPQPCFFTPTNDALRVRHRRGAVGEIRIYESPEPLAQSGSGLLEQRTPPRGVCGCLGYGDLKLLALFEGGLAEEQALQHRVPADSFEFWRRSRLPLILATLGEMGVAVLPLEPKPNWTEPTPTRRPCCGGKQYRCARCPATFATCAHLKQHVRDKHINQDVRTCCPKCGKGVKHARNLKAHFKTKACREA